MASSFSLIALRKVLLQLNLYLHPSYAKLLNCVHIRMIESCGHIFNQTPIHSCTLHMHKRAIAQDLLTFHTLSNNNDILVSMECGAISILRVHACIAIGPIVILVLLMNVHT